MYDIEVAELLSEILAANKRLESKINDIEKKVNQNLSSSSIMIDDDGVDLILRFIAELKLNEIDFDYVPGSYDDEDIKSKASYYFTNRSTIKSPRSYLLKIVSQLHPIKQDKPLRQIEGGSTSKSESEVSMLCEKFALITPDILQKVKEKHEKAYYLIAGQDLKSFTTFQKVVVTGFALKDGLI